MKKYLIKGNDETERTKFSVDLAEYLQNKGKVLLLQAKRTKNSNIEDYFKKDGTITYDIADYFVSLASLDKVLVSENDKLDFIISPLLEDKYEFTNEDFKNLFAEINYDYLILDGFSQNLLEDKVVIEIISQDQVNSQIDADAFFIDRVNDSYDVRLDKEAIDQKKAKFLGLVKNDEKFSSVIENLVNNTSVSVPKLGFFEKLKMGFRK